MAGSNCGYCSKENGSHYAVFCYSTLEVLTVQESQLESFQENFDEAVKKKKPKE